MIFYLIIYSVLGGICFLLFQEDSMWMQYYFLTVRTQRLISHSFKILLILCLILFANDWGQGLFNIQLLIESPKTRGQIELFWYLLAWLCVIFSLVFCRLWIKVTTTVLIVPALLIATVVGTFEANEQIATDFDGALSLVEEKQLSTNVNLLTYDYNIGAMC